jgi:hypothetical protein
MEIDIDAISKKYKDIDWSLEFAENEIRCLVGRKGKFYKAFAIPPHEHFTFKGKKWDMGAAKAIADIVRKQGR